MIRKDAVERDGVGKSRHHRFLFLRLESEDAEVGELALFSGALTERKEFTIRSQGRGRHELVVVSPVIVEDDVGAVRINEVNRSVNGFPTIPSFNDRGNRGYWLLGNVHPEVTGDRAASRKREGQHFSA